MIFPCDNEEINDGSDLYKRSHGSYAPGEQKKRDYNWNLNPETTRFGAKGDTIAFNGVADALKNNGVNTVVNTKKVIISLLFIILEFLYMKIFLY